MVSFPSLPPRHKPPLGEDVAGVDYERLSIGLAAMSYDLHEKLAMEFDGEEKWGYRTVDTLVSKFTHPFGSS